jgi:hypothetical protein
MPVEVLRYLEHGRLGGASEVCLQLSIGHDLALVLRILAAVVLDVTPELAGRLGASIGPITADSSAEGVSGFCRAFASVVIPSVARAARARPTDCSGNLSKLLRRGTSATLMRRPASKKLLLISVPTPPVGG